MKKFIISLCTFCFIAYPLKLFPSNGSQIARSIGKAVLRNAAKNSEKRTIKVISKGVLKEIPVGKEALKVIVNADGSCTPAIHNLGKNAVKYSDEFNRLILRERRSAISHAHQYISPERLKLTKAKANLTEASSRRKLRENIYARMEKEFSNVSKAFGGTEAHHVVEGNAKSAEASRKILKKFGIGINDAENGVLLRSDEASIYSGALHNTSHSPKYSEYVYSKIKNVTSREELILRLSEIKKDLVDGMLDLSGNVKAAKNSLIF